MGPHDDLGVKVIKYQKIGLTGFVPRFAELRHVPHNVQDAHGTTVRCRNCKTHARQLDFKRMCVPTVGTGVGLRSVSGGVSVLARSGGAGAGVGTSEPAR